MNATAMLRACISLPSLAIAALVAALRAQDPGERAALDTLRDSLARVTDSLALKRLEATTIDLAKRNREDPNYPYAWTYRDYVIKSFNDDKPYNQFIIEQLAGDELDNPAYDSVTATAFYRIGPRVRFRENLS